MNAPINSQLPEPIQRALEITEWVATTGWEHFAAICESPIERLLLEQMLASVHGGNAVTGFRILSREYVQGEPHFLSGHGIICYPQGTIGEYRADFVLDAFLPFKGRTIYVVECDGHEFHERTKEQAERDKQRDRFMVARGIKVLRYTGREIHRDAENVWREIVDIITDGRGGQWSHPHAHQRVFAA